jgi:antitoxin ParD1/3/4
MMNVNLGPVFDQFIADLLKTGHYQSQSEVVREGLRLLKEREDLREARLNELRRAIQEGVDAADRHELVDGPEALRRIRARGNRTKYRADTTERTWLTGLFASTPSTHI